MVNAAPMSVLHRQRRCSPPGAGRARRAGRRIVKARWSALSGGISGASVVEVGDTVQIGDPGIIEAMTDERNRSRQGGRGEEILAENGQPVHSVNRWSFSVTRAAKAPSAIRQVLIANRGEIALRVQRVPRNGIKTVVVHSEADRRGMFGTSERGGLRAGFA
jgi:hypothetical protein